MNCEQAETLLSAYVFGEVQPPALKELEEHLEGCATCAERLREMRAAGALLGEALEGAEAPELTEDRRAALAALKWPEQREGWRFLGIELQPPQGSWKPSPLLAAAVVVIVVAGAGMLLPSLSTVRRESHKSADKSNLNQIGKAAAVWLMRHGDNERFPRSMKQLLDDGMISDPGVFLSPATGTEAKNGEFTTDYECILDEVGREVTEAEAAGIPLAWDKDGVHEDGCNVVFFDAHVEWIDKEDLPEFKRNVAKARARLRGASTETEMVEAGPPAPSAAPRTLAAREGRLAERGAGRWGSIIARNQAETAPRGETQIATADRPREHRLVTSGGAIRGGGAAGGRSAGPGLTPDGRERLESLGYARGGGAAWAELGGFGGEEERGLSEGPAAAPRLGAMEPELARADESDDSGVAYHGKAARRATRALESNEGEKGEAGVATGALPKAGADAALGRLWRDGTVDSRTRTMAERDGDRGRKTEDLLPADQLVDRIEDRREVHERLKAGEGTVGQIAGAGERQEKPEGPESDDVAARYRGRKQVTTDTPEGAATRIDLGREQEAPAGAPEALRLEKLNEAIATDRDKLRRYGEEAAKLTTVATAGDLKAYIEVRDKADETTARLKDLEKEREGLEGKVAELDEAESGQDLPHSTDKGMEPDRPAKYRRPEKARVLVNPFFLTKEDNLSTFALETDTGSYTLTRGFIRRGYLPPAHLVRVEEFVNAFDYNYSGNIGRPFVVETECAPSPFRPGLYLLKVGVKAKVAGRDGRHPTNLVLCFDTSSSMGTPERLALAQKAAAMLVNGLRPEDRVSVVTYGTNARLALDATPVRDNRKHIVEAIRGLQADGSTNIAQGLGVAYQQAQRTFRSGDNNVILHVSDGIANVGSRDAEDILENVRLDRAQGITLHTAGVGSGAYDDRMMEQLADNGDGKYIFIDTEDEARRVFVENLAQMQVVARDAKIQVDFNPQVVRRYRLLGYETRDIADRDFRNDAVDAGEIGSGQSATALYELELVGTQGAIGTARVRYRDVETGEVEETAARIDAAHALKPGERTSPRFRLAAGAAQFAELLRGSAYARDGNLKEIAGLLSEVTAELPLDDRAAELLGLVRGAQGLPRAE